MIITFHGTESGNHGAAAIMVFYAAFTAFKTGKKCLMMSLCAPDRERNIENLGYAKLEQIEDTGDITAGYNGSGLTALIQRAETGNLDSENFQNCVVQQMKTANALDVAETATDDNVEADIDSRFNIFKNITDTAEEIYDYIFLLADSTNISLTKKVDELADRIVICVRQSKFVKPVALTEDAQKKAVFIISDFEPESAFNKKYLMHAYGVKQHMFVMPHNIKYKDACVQGTLIQFAMKNVSDTKADDNAYLVKCMEELSVDLFGKLEDKPDPSYLTMPKFDADHDEMPDLTPLSDPVITEKTRKKGLFGKETYTAAEFNELVTDHAEDAKKNDNTVNKVDRKPLFGRKKAANIDSTDTDSTGTEAEPENQNINTTAADEDPKIMPISVPDIDSEDVADTETNTEPETNTEKSEQPEQAAEQTEQVEKNQAEKPEPEPEQAAGKHEHIAAKSLFHFGPRRKKNEENKEEVKSEENRKKEGNKSAESLLKQPEKEKKEVPTEKIVERLTSEPNVHWHKMIARPIEAVYIHLFGKATSELTGDADVRKSTNDYMKYIKQYKPKDFRCGAIVAINMPDAYTSQQVGTTLNKYLKQEWKRRNPGMELETFAFGVKDKTLYLHIAFVPYVEGCTKGMKVRNSYSSVLRKNNVGNLDEWLERECGYIRTSVMENV